MTPVRFDDTPNPNALKCCLEEQLPGGMRSYRNSASAAEDPLAARLFELPGVRNVLINGDFVTVGKTPETKWKSLKPRIRAILEQADAH